ncbi:MAG: collagen-like protein [Mucinivorans sp.]
MVVTKPKLEHTRGDLAGYEFEFAHGDQSIYLNLPKVDTPELLEIIDPSEELFFLAPRLNQFAAAEMGVGDILIPCQYAGADKWLYVTVADIISNSGSAGGSGAGGPIKTLAPIGAKYVDGTLTITHNLAPADVSKFGTADKTGHAMVAPHPYGGSCDLDFAAKIASAIKLLLTDEASSPDYVKALTGFSLKKNEYNKWSLEIDNISVRESLSVPEFIKNRITVTNNQMWIADNGIVDDVAEITGSPGERLITVAQDKGGGSTFLVDDILRGLFLDEKNGSLNFQTVLLTVRQVISPYVLRVSIDENTPPPRKDLIIVRTGNRTNAERQNSIFIDAARPAMFFYVNVDSHQISERNIAQATGNLQGMNFGKITNYKPITERFSSIMRGDNYIAGRLTCVSDDGLEYRVPVDRGEWMAGTYYHYDRVSCDGAMWDCAVTKTTTRPAADALDWTKRVSEGAPGVDGKDGLPGLQGADGLQGVPGVAGADGRTSYFHIKYSEVANPTSAQITEVPSAFIGTYTDFIASDSADPASYKWARLEGLQGQDGTQGIPGVNGENGQTTYLHIKYSNDGGATFTANGGETSGTWIGQCTNFTLNDPTIVGAYKWSKIKGDHGAKGDYPRYVYLWSDTDTDHPPVRPVGSDPAGWAWNNSREYYIVNNLGQIVTDRSGRAITGRYSSSYRLWASVAYFSGVDDTLIGEWGVPYVQSGLDGRKGKDGIGKDGKSYEYIYRRTTTDVTPATPETAQQDEWTPDQWTDDPMGVDASNLYEWISQRVKTDGAWSVFSTPSIWAKFGKDGNDGKDVAPDTVDKIYSEIDKMAHGFGFDTAMALSEYLKLPMGKIFDYNPATGILKLSTLIAKRIATDEAFINELVITRLRSTGGLVLLDDTQAQFGALRIKTEDGSVSVLDAQGVERVNIKSGNIDSLDTLKNGDSAIGPIYNDSATFSTSTTTELPNKIVVTKNASTLKVLASLNASATIHTSKPISLPYAIITLVLTKNGTDFRTLGRAAHDETNHDITGEVGANWSGTVDAGTYGLRLTTQMSQANLGTNTSARVAQSSMQAGYVERVMRTQIGANGIFSYWNSNKYLYAAENGNGDVFLEVKGKTDMSGVLAKARVDIYGFIDKQWGKYAINKVDNISGSSGNKRVWHTPITGLYSTFCTGYAGADNPKVYNETTEYVDLYANGAFNIMLIGSNE